MKAKAKRGINRLIEKGVTFTRGNEEELNHCRNILKNKGKSATKNREKSIFRRSFRARDLRWDAKMEIRKR